ncbi:MAG: MBL fold metallo-hydrolase [Oscillospiraceae bacterium]
MTYNIISTGSSGNAVVFNDIIMIDCGVSFKALQDIYKKLKIVLLTHIHSDHFNAATIKKLAFERPSLRFACCEWLVEPLINTGVKKQNIDVLNVGNKYDYSAFSLSPIQLHHNVPNCGYRLFLGAEKAMYATDTGTLDGISAKEYDYYFIEANYTDEEMAERIAEKQAEGVYPYEYEVMKNHLSKAKCDNFIYENAGGNSKYLYLHQHIEKVIL